MLVVSLSGSGGGAKRRWTLRFMCKTFVLVREAEGREEEGKGARFIFSRPAREEEMWEEEEEKGEEGKHIKTCQNLSKSYQVKTYQNL